MPVMQHAADPAVGSLPLTVVIAARNESCNIAECIDSVRWADEILVADHGSDDATAIMAAERGATVVDCANAATIGAVRNSAIAFAANQWVLVVDADERGDVQLAAAVANAIGRSAFDAYRVPRRNFFLGREIRHGGWGSDAPVRLFRSGLRYDDRRVHEHIASPGPVGTLDAALLHVPYASMDAYFEKFERYSRWWAQDQSQRGRRVSAAAIIVKPPARFVSTYLFRLGILDGARGLVLATLASASVLAKYVRLWAIQCGS